MKTKYKLIAAALLTGAAVVHLLNTGYHAWSVGGSPTYVAWLALVFFWREAVNDERVRSLKLKALTVAFVIGYCASVGARIALQAWPRPELTGAMSAYDFMFVTIVSAFVLFHAWQWRDGRDDVKRES